MCEGIEEKGPHGPAKIMQEAAQTEEENSLCIILVVDRSEGKMHDSSQKLFI